MIPYRVGSTHCVLFCFHVHYPREAFQFIFVRVVLILLRILQCSITSLLLVFPIIWWPYFDLWADDGTIMSIQPSSTPLIGMWAATGQWFYPSIFSLIINWLLTDPHSWLFPFTCVDVRDRLPFNTLLSLSFCLLAVSTVPFWFHLIANLVSRFVLYRVVFERKTNDRVKTISVFNRALLNDVTALIRFISSCGYFFQLFLFIFFFEQLSLVRANLYRTNLESTRSWIYSIGANESIWN